MNRSRKYNLEAVFSARNEASDTLAKVRKDIDDIADALQRLGALKSDPTIGLSGDKEAQASAKKTKSDLKDVAGTYKARIRVDKDKALTTLNKDKALLKSMFDRDWELKLDGKDVLTQRAQLTKMQADLRNMFGRAYRISIDDSQSKIARKNAELLASVLDKKIARTREVKVKVDGLVKSSAQVSAFEKQLQSLARNWDVDITVDRNRTALSAAINITSAFDGLQKKILAMGNAATQFSRGIYSVQQGLYAFRAALMVVAVAAAGPVLSGLTILGATLVTLAGGLGLVAAAGIPLVQAFSQQEERANAAEQATSDLQGAQESAAAAARTYKSSLDSAADAHRAVGQAAEDAAQANAAAEDALEDARASHVETIEALESAEEDLADIRDGDEARNQKQAELDLRSARLEVTQATKDYNTAVREEGKNSLEAKQAAIALEQAQLDLAEQQEETNEVRRKGSEELRAAKEAAKSAASAEQSAAKGVTQAEENLINTREEGRRTVLEARRAAADADREAKLAAQELARAQKEVANKQRELATATKPLARGLETVMRLAKGVQQAYNTHFAGAQAVVNRLAARTLILANRAMPALGQSAERTALGIERAFDGLGKDAGKFGALSSLRRILNSMPAVTQRWTRAFGRFGQGFLNIMAQAMPFVRQFSRWINRVALDFLKWTRSEKGRKQIKDFFQAAGPVARALWNAVRRIGAALLKWSVKNPQQVAHAIEALAGAAIFAGKWLGRIVFFIIRMAEQHPGMTKLVVAALALGVAVSSLSPLLLAAGLATRLLIRGFVKTSAIGVRAAIAVGARWLLLRTVFGLIAASIGIAIATAYREIIGVTVPTIRGLSQMWKSGSITQGQFFLNVWRQVMASWAKLIGQTAINILKFLNNVMKLPTNFLFGKNNKGMFDGLVAEAQQGMDRLYNTIRGGTNKSAEALGKNLGQGEKAGSRELKQLASNTKQNMGQASQSTEQNMVDMKLAMRKELAEGSQSGQNSLKQLLMKGSGYNKQLSGKTNQDFKNIMGSITSNTQGAETKGLANFLGLKNTGGQHMFDLRSKSDQEMGKARQGIQSSTYAARQKGIQNLTELEEQGATAMSMAQEKWVDTSWNASLQMQQAMNSILEAMGKFIEAAGIDMKKPGQFGLIGRKGGDLRGSANNRGLVGKKGNQHVDRRARGGIDEFAMGGRAQAPVGGIAGGTTRVYGEVPGTTEFYVTDNPRYRKRNLEILRAANRHMGAPMGEGDPRGNRIYSAKGRIWNTGSGEGIYGPTNNSLWDKATLERANKIIDKFRVAVNTYENHPPGYPQYAQSSIDSWDYAGRGTPIGYPSPHNEVKNFIETQLTQGLKWTLGEGDAGHSGSYRHVHATWEPNGAAGSGGFTGGSNAPSVDYDAMFERMIPKAPKIGQSIIANAAEAIVRKGRSEVKEMLMKKVPGQPGTSPYNGGGNLDQWIKQGLQYGNAFDASASNVEQMKSRAVQESGGNPLAINDWDSNAAAGTPSKGLFQIIEPTWESYRKTYGADAGPFDSKWDDPVMSAAVASRYMKGEYGHIVGATGSGYAKGGVHKGLPVSMPRRMENAFLAVADVLRNFTSKGDGLAVGDGGGVGSGRHPVAITNEAGPEAIVPLRRKTPQGRYALAVANRAYNVPGFAAGGVVKQGWNLVGSDGKLGIGGPAAQDVLAAARLWSGAGVTIGPGSDVNASYSSGTGAARTTSAGAASMNPQYQGTPGGLAMWAHEIGHMLGLGHGGPASALMSNPVSAGDKPSSAELAAAKQLWHGPTDMTGDAPGRRTASGGGGGGGGSRRSSGGGGVSGRSGGGGSIRGRGSTGGSRSAGVDAKEIAGRVEKAVEGQTKRLERKLNEQLGELKNTRNDLTKQVPRLIGQFIKGGLDFTLEHDPDTRRHVRAGQDRLAGVKRLAGRN